MMFFKKIYELFNFNKNKDNWFDFTQKPPEHVEILFCDYYKIWIGKFVYDPRNNIENHKFTGYIMTRDNTRHGDFWIMSSQHQHPVCWRYLPNMSERKNL